MSQKLVLAALLCSSCMAAPRTAPPKTRVDKTVDKLHGVDVPDPYRWLEDQKSPETRTWLEEQNKFTRSVLDANPELPKIRERLGELMKVETIGIPRERGGRYFYSKRLANQDQPSIYMRTGLKGKEEVLVDPATLGGGKTTSASVHGISRDGKLLAYGVRKGGEDEVSISILDVETRKLLPDSVARGRNSGLEFLPDKSGFYYSRQDPTGPMAFYHRMGTAASEDKQIFGKGYGNDKGVGVSLTQDGRYLTFTVWHGSAGKQTEIYYQDLHRGEGIKPIVNDIEARFGGRIEDGRIYLETNWKAPNGRVLVADLKNPARENWRELVPERSYALQNVELAGGKLALEYMENVTSRIEVIDAEGKPVRTITFPALGTTSGLSGDWDRDEAFYAFNSIAMPQAIYRYSLSTGKQEIFARVNVPVKDDPVEVKQVWYESKDKTRIPMFIAHRKGLKLDGTAPTLLTGYGGFTVSMTPSFSATAAYWIERGGVYALPNLRGGGEFGEAWHEAGMLEKKQNVFDDFIAAAEWLISNKYTRPSRLAIRGGSNGGLLVGAAVTQRPELFGAALCAVPLLDMVRYHQFKVAKWWVPEYGSSEDAKQFEYIYRYSPYHHVDKGARYGAVMFVTGDSDTRVDPLHARKMAARMQEANASDKPILLHYDMSAGHSAGLPVSKLVEDAADDIAFLLSQLQ